MVHPRVWDLFLRWSYNWNFKEFLQLQCLHQSFLLHASNQAKGLTTSTDPLTAELMEARDWR